MRLLALPASILTLVSSSLLLLPSLVRADVKFTAPAAGAKVAVGTIDVQWEDSGIAPPLSSLTAYSLLLVTGGNKDDEMLTLSTFVSQGSFRSGNSVSGTIPAGIAEAAKNGFFFKIISASSTGGTVINYSDRFTITGLTGYTDQSYLNAIKALDGSTTGPPSVGDAASSSSTQLSSTTIITTSSNTPLTVTSALTTRASASSVPPARTHLVKSGGSGISTGALVGIAIGGAVVGIIGVAVALFACLRWRKRKEVVELKTDMDFNGSSDMLRREMSPTTPPQPPVELDPYSVVVEAGDGMRPSEMDSMNVRAELEGDYIPQFGPPLTPIPMTPIENLTLDSQATLIATQPRDQF